MSSIPTPPAPPAGPPPPMPPDRRRPVWDEVAGNQRNSWLLLIAFGLLLGGLSWLFGRLFELGPAAPVLAVGIAGAGAWASYYYSDRLVLAASQARPADPARHAPLINIVDGLAIAAGVPSPKIYTIDDSAPNAFATGRNPANAAVVVTTGLMDKLERVELEGVIAHEMSHVRNYDIRMATLAGVLVGSVALLSDWMLRSMRWGMWRGRGGRRGQGGAILLIVAALLAILAPIAAQMLRLALSRQREFLADANGALLTRYPEGLARALEKISADTEPLEVANRATAPLYIVNPLLDYQGRRSGLFDTHPPIEERIRRLRSM